MTSPKMLRIETMEYFRGRKVFLRAITAMSVIRTLSIIKDDTTDPVTKDNLQKVIDMIYDSRPTV